MSGKRRPGQRAGLTLADVLQAARTVLVEAGAAGLTMRAVAAQVGVRPNTLYSHVRDKNGLVDALLDDTLATVARPRPDVGSPVDALRQIFASTYDVLAGEPDLVPLYLRRQGVNGPNAQRLGDLVVDQLRRAGVDGEQAKQALRVLIVHTIGSAAFDHPATTGEARASFERSLDWLISGITQGGR